MLVAATAAVVAVAVAGTASAAVGMVVQGPARESDVSNLVLI